MSPEALIAVRWVHFVAGITWIGLLYFFNFVNVRTMATIDQGARPAVVTTLLPRALAWFRHSAWVTVLAGLLLIYGLYWSGGDFFGSNGSKTVGTGAVLGLLMLINVWALIWPNQRRIIEATRSGAKADPAWGRQALYASRANFTMSFPMLFFMAGSSHYPMDWGAIVVVGIVLAALGFGTVLSVQKWWAARF
ncbi:MAG TPA: urate hydroxylase PuuD [Candidatus Limnocylindria bacterium]|jgi:uncharacterized membrane protein|nr:urate hydroxylase PuuD [Candidatus Limnocylindria bacterium]